MTTPFWKNTPALFSSHSGEILSIQKGSDQRIFCFQEISSVQNLDSVHGGVQPEKTSVNPKVIIVEATGSVKDARQDLRKAAQQHHGVPVLLVLDTKRNDAEELLSLPASDFHDSNSGEALLKKRINHLSNAPKLPAAVTSTLEFDFLKEEMQLWQSLFENSSTGMLSGDSRPFLSALRQQSDKSARGCATQTFSLADTPLSSVKWELNNQKAQKLLNLKEPVALSNTFLHKLKPEQPEQFLSSLEQLGSTQTSIHTEVQSSNDKDSVRHLSLNISINSNNLLLVTILDITRNKKLEEELRDHLKLLESRVKDRTHDIAISHQRLASEGTQRQRLTGQLRESLAHITQSVIGAKRILEVALPGREELNSIFPNSVLIDRPRDIMGGDFLFTGVKNGKKTLALIDSTGHGIPGAMVSLMGSSLVNKAFTSLKDPNPSNILVHFQEEFDIRMQVNQGTPQMYGFDAAVITQDPATKTIQFSGARGDLFLVRDGETQTIRGSRASIDLMKLYTDQVEATEYELHNIEYQDGDQFYILSDGVRDQFGGERSRKLGRKRLCDILAKHHKLPHTKREKAIQKDLLIWKGANAKVDDATLVGIQC